MTIRRFLAATYALVTLAGCSAADLATLSAGPVLTTFGGGFGGLKGTAPSAGATASAPLSAGSVDDNLGFAAYLGYLARYKGQPMRGMDVSERHVIRVRDAAGKSVPSAEVIVSEGADTRYQARSFADGRQHFHPRVSGAVGKTFTVRASKGGIAGAKTFTAGDQQAGEWVVTLDGTPAAPKRDLQVLFMLDATGSMGGEIAQLQETIRTIAKRVADTGSTASYGLVAYRDRGEDWVVKKKDFTTDVAAFETSLMAIEADAGGDYPEDMEAGLVTATKELSWSEGDATRLTFLIADAPPHVTYPDGVPYTRSALNAACKGVKIFGVGCSGLEEAGEYALRQLSQFTMAKYLFLTRGGDSKAGGGAVSASVATYSEKRLDDLIVEQVQAELGSLGK
jgi:hypothetical protein